MIDSAISLAPVLYDPVTGDVTGLDLNAVLRGHHLPADYDWSPDGTALVYSFQNTLQVLDLIDGGTELLTFTSAIDPEWSPDGTAIAFNDHSQLEDHIMVIDLNDLTETTVARARRRNAAEGQYVFRPKWSPSGTHLLYHYGKTSGFSEQYHIYRVGRDGGNPTKLTGDLESTWSGVWILGWR